MLALLVFLLATASPKPPKAVLTIYVSPQVALRSAGQPAVVRAEGMSLKDPLREWLCPTFTLEWGDDSGRTIYSGWCDPYTLYEDTPTLWRMESRAHRYWKPGMWTVTLTATAGKRRMVRSVTVYVR